MVGQWLILQWSSNLRFITCGSSLSCNLARVAHRIDWKSAGVSVSKPTLLNLKVISKWLNVLSENPYSLSSTPWTWIQLQPWPTEVQRAVVETYSGRISICGGAFMVWNLQSFQHIQTALTRHYIAIEGTSLPDSFTDWIRYRQSLGATSVRQLL